MTPSPFGRILWKEARAQFSLWLALILGAILFQTIIVAYGPGPATTRPVVATAFVLTCCFTVASLALLFAGETEDGTRDWLMQLPIRPATLIGAKLTFTLVATLVYVVVVWITGFLAMAFEGHTAFDMFRAEVASQFPIKMFIGLCIWGLLFAFICRRVMFALLGTVIAEVITVAVTDNIYGPDSLIGLYDPRTMYLASTITYAAVLAIVFVFDVVLALRWANGGGGTMAVAPRAIRKLSPPLASWRSQTWLRLVAWAAQRGSLSARETAVLVWREARGAAPFAVVWCLVGLLATDILNLPIGEYLRGRPFQPFFLLVTPALCGLMTCLGDQRQQTFRFLAERGVSPSRVWILKQCVWLPLAVIIVLLFLRWDSTAGERVRATNSQAHLSLFMQVTGSIRAPTLTPARWFDRPEDVELRHQFLWATGLLLFAAGQCAGFWIRRSILAVAAALIATPLIAGWNTTLVAADIPLSLASWPLAIALMAATFIGASGWLRGRDSWKLRFVRLAAIALPVCAVATAAAAHRAFSIPKVDNLFTEPADLTRFNMREMLLASDPEWSQQWRLITRPHVHDLYSQTQRESTQLTELADRRLELLKLAEGIQNNPPRLDPLVLSPDRLIHVSGLMVPLTNVPVLALEASRSPVDLSVAGKWHDFEAGLRITRYLAEESQSAEQWMECLRARQPLLKAIVEWSRRADQTPEALQQAFDFLVSDLLPQIGGREMAINRYAFYSQLLQHRGPKWDKIEDELEKYGKLDLDTPTTAAALAPGFERERLLRLLGQTTTAFMPHGNAVRDASAVEQEHEWLARWAATTPLLPMNVQTEVLTDDVAPQLLPTTLNGVFLSVHTQEAGTALVVALQRFRLLHGEFPLQLSEVIPPQYSNVWPFIDRHTNTSFGYEPKGLPGDLYLAGGRVLRAGQPLLWSAGFGNGRFTPTGADIPTRAVVANQPIDPGIPIVPRGAYYAPQGGAILPVGDFQFLDARPDQIEFVNAGSQPTW